MDAPATSGEIFNVGSTERVSIVDLAERVLAATGSRSEIVYVPYDEVYGQGIEDMLHRQPVDREGRRRDRLAADADASTRSSPT